MWDKREDNLVHEEEPYNAEPRPGPLNEHAVTPTDAFYSRNHGPIPDVEVQTWRLRVGGLVDRPLSLSLEDLRGLEPHHVEATLQCAGNRRAGFLEVEDIPGEDPWRGGAIGNATWTGARLRDVIAAASPGAVAQHVAFSAPDVSTIPDEPTPYGSSIPIGKAMGPDVLVAWEMNGEPLPRVHGAPARIVVPGYVGARSVKWVEAIELREDPSDNYFQATAYRILPPDADPDAAGPGDGISLGPWSLNCEILLPDACRPPGPCRVAGYAVAAEHRSVALVEVSLDAGRTWATAELDHAGPWTWCRWHLDLTLPTGTTTIVARARDDSGAQQPRLAADLWNPKGYANTSWPTVTVTVE